MQTHIVFGPIAKDALVVGVYRWALPDMLLVHVINGENDGPDFADVKNFLLNTPRGAYTTILVTEGFIIANWDAHVERLIKSLAALHSGLDGYYAAYYRQLKVTATHLGISPPGSHTAKSPTPRCLQETPQASEASIIRTAILPSLLKALHTANTPSPSCTPLMATIILPPGRGASALDVHVAVAPAPPPPQGSCATATILGGPRAIPIGKDTGWVAQRQSLEALRPEGAVDVLLCTSGGQLLEGLVTNVFVVREGPGGGAVVETAGMETGVVWGTLRNVVLQSCADLGIVVVERPPDMAARSNWKEAFITNR